MKRKTFFNRWVQEQSEFMVLRQVEALKLLAWRPSIPLLERIFELRTEPAVRAAVLDAVGEIGGPKAKRFLIQVIQTEESDTLVQRALRVSKQFDGAEVPQQC